MDGPEPESTPFDAISSQSNKFYRRFQAFLDSTTPYTPYRWLATFMLLTFFWLKIIISQGWYIVAYCLGIYMLNLFLAFLSPKFDPSLSSSDDDDLLEGGGSGGILGGGDKGKGSVLPTKEEQEFKPFVRKLPEFKFWYAATRAIVIAFVCSWFPIFDLPVFWPVLVMYWVVLVILTMRRQIQHMIKYRYIPFSLGKTKYSGK